MEEDWLHSIPLSIWNKPMLIEPKREEQILLLGDGFEIREWWFTRAYKIIKLY